MKHLIIGNWKLNKTRVEIEEFFLEFSKLYKPVENLDVLVCPSFPYLNLVNTLIEKYSLANLYSCAQDVSEFEFGQYTSQVCAKQVADFSKYCLVGHSETSATAESVLKKIENCLNAGLTPIVCVSNGAVMLNLVQHLPTNPATLVYEAPGNISKDGEFKVLSIEEISKEALKIKEIIGADKPLIYGGSVNMENIDSLVATGLFAGYLPGKASLSATDFSALISRI